MEKIKGETFKSKASYLPFNFIWCAATFGVCFTGINALTDLPTITSICISTLIYLKDVLTSAERDILRDRIKDLETKSNP